MGSLDLFFGTPRVAINVLSYSKSKIHVIDPGLIKKFPSASTNPANHCR